MRITKAAAMAAILATAAATSAPVAAQAPQAAYQDPCAGKALCENPGPFAVEVVQGSAATNAGYHDIRVVLRVRNTGATPLVLGYVRSSGTMDDELGNRYEVDWRYDQHVNGIGVVAPRSADARFVLAPGASRNFTLTYRRALRNSPGIGQSYSPALTLAQLEPLSANQVRTVTDYSLNFTGLQPNGLATAAGDALTRKLDKWLGGKQR